MNKKYIALTKILLSFFLVGCCVTNSFAQADTLRGKVMVQNFYALHQQPLFWLSSVIGIERAKEWLTVIDSAANLGIVPDKLNSDQIHGVLLSKISLDAIIREAQDRQITGTVLKFIKNLQEGNIKFDYDEINIPRDSVYISQLLSFQPIEPVYQIVSRLDCKDRDYLILKEFLKDSITRMDTLKYRKVALAMNYRRYFTVNHPTEYIMVNIPAADARYYHNDVLRLKMRTVVGKKDAPTPTIASYIKNIVTFPHWNVPHSIAVKEILPKVQLHENYLEQNNYDVVNAKGRVIDDSKLKWKSYTEENFPYFFRQATGPRNSLGVMKFNLQNPFDIFLHSTSWQGAFAQKRRFLSHGCVRLEKPFELAKILMPDKINIKELKSGKKNTESKTIKLSDKIPVFIVYVPVTVVGKKVTFLQDEYGLIK
jgi:hypothetical protein